MVPVGKDLRLIGQIGAPRIDKVDAGEPVFPRDLLGAQMLLDGDRVVRAAFYRGVIAHDHTLAPGNPEVHSALVTALSSLSSDDPPALEATREVYDTVTEIIRGAMNHGEELKAEVIRVLAMVWFAALFARVRGWENPRQMGDDLENAVRLLLPGSDGKR